MSLPEELQAKLFARKTLARDADLSLLTSDGAQGELTSEIQNSAHVNESVNQFTYIACESFGPPLCNFPLPMGAWPARVDIPCWNCAHAFDTPPIPLPLESVPRVGRYRIEGIFCTVSCALRYLHTEYKHNPLYRDMEMMLKDVAHRYFGVPADVLRNAQMAPHPQKTLRRWQARHGVSIEEYRDERLVARSAPVLEPPFLGYGAVMEASVFGLQRHWMERVMRLEAALSQCDEAVRARLMRESDAAAPAREHKDDAGYKRNPVTGAHVFATLEDATAVERGLRSLRRPLTAGAPPAPGVNEPEFMMGGIGAPLATHMNAGLLSASERDRLSVAARKMIKMDDDKCYGRAAFDDMLHFFGVDAVQDDADDSAHDAESSSDESEESEAAPPPRRRRA